MLKLVYIRIDSRNKKQHYNAYFGGFREEIRFVEYSYSARSQKNARNKRAHYLRQMNMRGCKPENFRKKQYKRKRQQISVCTQNKQPLKVFSKLLYYTTFVIFCKMIKSINFLLTNRALQCIILLYYKH